MKVRTRWRTWDNNNPIIGKRLFHESFGFFKIIKIQSCKEYCENATTPER